MRLHLDPSHKGLYEFVKKLPTLFERGEGTVLHAGRNTIRLLAQEGANCWLPNDSDNPEPCREYSMHTSAAARLGAPSNTPYGSSASASGRRSRLPGVNTTERGV